MTKFYHRTLVLILPACLHGAPLFKEVSADLGAPQPCAETWEGCYSNYVAMVDLSGDGVLDVIFANGGGYYAPGDAEPMVVYFNNGVGQFSRVDPTLFGGFTGRLRQISTGDIDGDGDIDVFAPDSWGLQPDALFINPGKANTPFEDQGPLRLGTSSTAGATRMGDVDGDGDLDILVSDWGDDPPISPGTAQVFLNDGHGYFVERPNAVPQTSTNVGTGPVDLDLLDVDGDWDLDLLLASREGDSLLFFNNGKGDFTFDDAALPPQPGPYTYGPDGCNVDGDRDLDLWLDNAQSGLHEQLLINDGTGHFRDETATRVPIPNNLRADDNEVQCVDIDNDLDMDLVIASLSNVERVLINDGQGHFTLQRGTFPRVDDATLGLDVGDLNGDGLLDVVTAQGERGDFTNRLYRGVVPQQRDTWGPQFRDYAIVMGKQGTGEITFWAALVDRSTTDTGPRLRDVEAHAQMGPDVPFYYLGGDLFRATLTGTPGTSDVFEFCATDPSGNTTCSPPTLPLEFP